MKGKKGILVAPRIGTTAVVHPRSDYTQICSKCKEPVALCPSSMRVLSTPGEVTFKIVCLNCVIKLRPKSLEIRRTEEALDEVREALEFAKKQRTQ